MAQNSAVVRRLDDADVFSVGTFASDTAEVVFRGYVTKAAVERAVGELRERLIGGAFQFLVIDGGQISGYEADVRKPGVQLLRVAREAGIRGGVCVSPSSAVRMMGAAVAFVASLPFDFVAHRSMAIESLSRQRMAMRG